MQPLLRVKELAVDFITEDGLSNALNGVSFDLKQGEILALVGESGSGKSVTALSILQLNPSPPARYSSGEIVFHDPGSDKSMNLLALKGEQMQPVRGNKIAMIFQEPMTSLNPVMSCGRQVVEALQAHKKTTDKEASQLAVEWFEKVKLPNPSAIYHRYPHELSGGQKQRVMIAMAMCCDPAILICDEPTTALDVTVQRTILDLIRELQQRSGMGVIFITHDLGVVAEIADRALVMYKGDIVEQGEVSQIFRNPVHPYTKALIACRPVNHTRGERLPVVSDFLNPGKESDTRLPRAVPKKLIPPEILLEARNLSVWFPASKAFFGKPKAWIRAVDDVSFSVFKGETLGLVGESGCGKTTLGRTLLRLIEPTGGTVYYQGKDLFKFNKEELRGLRKEMQIVFQDPYSSLNPRITIGDAIAEPLKVHGIRHGSASRNSHVKALLEKVDLKPEHFTRYPHEFSGGQRQRIVIARALALNPSFLVCDESVSALDVSVQAQVLNLLNDLKSEFGFTIIFISHDLSVVRYISDRMIVMQAGKIEEEGPSDEIYNNPQSPYTRKLINSIPRGLTA